MSPFNLLVDSSSLQSYGVSRMLKLDSRVLTSINTPHVFFLIRGRIELINLVANAIRAADKSASDVKFHLFLVPRGTLIAESKLAELGVLGSFDSIIDLPVVYPLDSDLLTLDMSGGLYEYAVTGDMSLFYDVASSLMHLQSIYGTIPVIRGIGSAARIVVDLMHKLRHEQQGDLASYGERASDVTSSNLLTTSTNSSGELVDSPLDGLLSGHKIDSLLLIDRRADLITPFLSQSTYEGLIDDFFAIRHNTVKLPAEKFVPDSNETKNKNSPDESKPEAATKSLILSSAEELYSKLRDLNFKSVGPFLHATSKRLSSVKTESITAKSIKDLKAIVEKLPYFQVAKKSVANHIAIAELIKEKFEDDFYQELILLERDLLNLELNEKEVPLIETLIYTGSTEGDLIQILRLISLQSQTTGIRKATLEFYKKELIDSYGAALLPVLYYLESSGLIRTGNSFSPSNLLSPPGPVTSNRSPSLSNIFAASGRDSAASSGSNGSNGTNNPFTPFTQSAFAVASAVTSVATTGNYGTYALLKRCLNLTDANYGERANNPASSPVSSKQLYSVYSGYVPLSIKLVELSFKPGWSSGTLDALRILAPSHTSFEEIQFSSGLRQEPCSTNQSALSPVTPNNPSNRSLSVPNVLQRRGSNSSVASSSPAASVASGGTASALTSPTGVTGTGEESKVVLVVFIGGCTLSEVSGLRLLSQVEESNVEFITLTTKILTANNFIRTFTCTSVKSFDFS